MNYNPNKLLLAIHLLVIFLSSSALHAFLHGNHVSRVNTIHNSVRLMSMKEGEAKKDEPKSKVKRGPTWMYNRDGIAYAPWMVDKFDPENLEKIEASLEARKQAKANAVAESVGDLAKDPQAMELSGLGLNLRNVNGDVELEWKTADETGNKVASYKDFTPLASKGQSGGVYRFIDPDSQMGTWIYRISDVNEKGVKNDLCQALIEVQSESEALQAKVAVALIGVAIIAAVASAFLIDPLQ